jgi:hypothetical protein
MTAAMATLDSESYFIFLSPFIASKSVGGSSVKKAPQTLLLVPSITGDSRQYIWGKYAWLLHAIAG